MTTAQYLMLAAAVVSGLAWRWNATSAALAFGYFATQALYLIVQYGDVQHLAASLVHGMPAAFPERTLEPGQLFMIDVAVIALIFCKAVARCPEVQFRNMRHQLRCMVESFAIGDRIVLGCFPLMWAAYALHLSGFARWWALFALAMIQFAAAGSDALTEWRLSKAPRDKSDTPSSGLMFAVAGLGDGG